ncbi:Holliday junction branch migration protein RuvA [Corynebacterium glucuronolyticum]|uniref:Holliday junction branch migration complex subunit RuvA n=1 Tax=Corynebacterium glucuronolyticum TaxID=39791 RepID=A0A7T4EE10_9CORY|nr:Holliday junction branch migration protein RuvA [Corynebacterium glucuronolyticum]QQB45634.1 Holliday junction branch migration protein RuvA [Corynebacterium glucuronolyticum]WKD63700.1 Holliday junction ATP-dependent DNA helicase RuvA [Corynebacterium glucuronolyticum DSM 44120]SMB80785.1 Holliday junction DNA helicase subunit RuvA [Corynebacterium glucuronolyticum]
MIASLHGEVVAKSLTGGVIECGGVGYEFLATAATLAELPLGEDGRVLTTMVIGEKFVTLYGFAHDSERTMFSQLQGVQGLGPKLALACLNTYSPSEIAVAVANDDKKTLQAIPGVGARMAAKMTAVLDGKLNEFIDSSAATSSAAEPVTGGSETVVAALVQLGFDEDSANHAAAWSEESNPGGDTGTNLRHALQYLGKKK